jgi:integrase
MKAKLTKRTVDAARPGKRDTFLWDSEIVGFGLKVTPAGSRVYVLQYRIGDHLRRYTIGKHGSPWTPEGARREASRLRGQVAVGIDPAERRAEDRNTLTVSELCDLYLSEGTTTKKPSTLLRDRSRIERHIKPLLGKRSVRSITRADVERFMQDVAAGKTATNIKTGFRGRAIVTGGKGAARFGVALLGSIFTFAVQRGLRPDNPAWGVKKYQSRKMERFLSAAELARLGEILKSAEQEGESPTAIAAVRLLMLTGARKGEILGLEWDWVDFEHRCLRLPDSKTGAKVIPLGAPALELLASLPRIDDCRFVLPSEKSDGHFVGLQKAWERIRKCARLEDVRLHDLRHSFASVAVAGGDSLYLVGKVLGHRQSATTERYAHLADDPLQAVANRTAATIAAAMNGGQKAEAEVVKLPKRKA